jgi:uncharacterized protein (TIGR03067 family)
MSETLSPSPLEGEGSRAAAGEGNATKAIPSPGGEAPPPSPSRGEGKKGRRFVRLAAVALLLAVGGFPVWYFAIREPEPRNDLERFQGDWKLTVGGRDTPNAVRVAGDRWQYVAGGEDGKAYRLTLNEAADPKQIDLELLDTVGLRGAPVKMHGVYAFDGNKTVRVRIEPALLPRPATLDDPDAVVWVLTKVKIEPAPASKK